MRGQQELDRFKDYLLGEKKSKSTQESYVQKVKQMLERINKELSEITQDDLDAYKVHLAKQYSQNSMIPHIAAINAFCKHILKKEALRLKPPPKIKKNKVALTVEETLRMLEVAKKDPMTYAMLSVLYYTGIRRTELVNLNLTDIDFERGKLRINNGKGNDYSTINIHPVAVEAIRRYLPYRIKPMDGSDALFVSVYRRRICKNVVEERVKESAIRAGIQKRVYPHLLRTSMITHMAENGASVKDIQAQSRHKDIETLVGYISPTDEHVRNVYLRTLPSIDQERSKERQFNTPLTPHLTDELRKKSLFDKYIAGEIDKDTFVRALDLLELKKKSSFDIGYQ